MWRSISGRKAVPFASFTGPLRWVRAISFPSGRKAVPFASFTVRQLIGDYVHTLSGRKAVPFASFARHRHVISYAGLGQLLGT